MTGGRLQDVDEDGFCIVVQPLGGEELGFFQDFFDPRPRTAQNLGSGVLIDARTHPASYAVGVGVNVNRVISTTFVIGSALAAIGGVLVASHIGQINFYIGFIAGIKAFTAAVLGGIGSLPGAVIGGLLIGLIEVFWSAYFSIDYKDVAAFSILAITLIFMPSGILGKPDVEKV